MSDSLIFFTLGLAYAYAGFFITMYLDNKLNNFVSSFADDNDSVVCLVLILWPVMLPFCYLIYRLFPQRG